MFSGLLEWHSASKVCSVFFQDSLVLVFVEKSEGLGRRQEGWEVGTEHLSKIAKFSSTFSDFTILKILKRISVYFET